MFVICIHHASDFCSRKLLTFGHHSPSSRFASSIGIGSLGLHNPRSHQQQPLNLVQDGQDGLNKAKSLGGPYEFFPMILISYPHISFSWVINMHPKKSFSRNPPSTCKFAGCFGPNPQRSEVSKDDPIGFVDFCVADLEPNGTGVRGWYRGCIP